jgi:(R,R)-butanediol dehydrogenase/meso-butanediol dehydrogenase/diacetyl reductase
MKAMYAKAPKDYVIQEVPEPKVDDPKMVLCKPLYTGICFSDKHAYEGMFPHVVARAGNSSDSGGVPGHEWAGEVVEIGDEVETVKVGDRIVLNVHYRCGKCLGCRSGIACLNRSQVSPWTGGFAELALAHESTCHVLPDTISDLRASYVEPASCGTRSTRFSGVAAGDNVVFLGAEDYCLSAFQWVRGIAGTVVVADPSPARRKMVESLGGATEIIDPTVTDPVASVKELMPWGADVVFVGSEGYVPRSHGYVAEAISMARPQGIVVTSRHQGFEELPAPIASLSGPTPTAFNKELKLLGFGVWFGDEPIYGGRERGDYQRTIDAMVGGRICGSGWEPTVVAFADMTSKKDVDEVFQGLPNQTAKVLLKINGN